MSPHRFLLGLVFAVHLSAQVRVINDGFPGENTSELDARLDDALQRFRPDYVVLFAGGNDALNDKKFLPASDTRAYLRDMAHRVRHHKAQVIMVTVHDPDLARLMTRHKPEAYGDTPPLQRLALVNEQIRRVAQGEHVRLVPFASVLQKAGGANAELSTDGVHLTGKGYGLLAAAVRTQLPKKLPTSATVLCFGDSLTYGIGVRPANSRTETAETYPAQLRALLNRQLCPQPDRMPCMSTMLAPPVQETSDLAEAIEAHVHRMLQSSHFARADTQRKLLQYLWDHRGENVSEYALATEALGRSANFDPGSDASVRVHISRLRRKLKDYYQLEQGEPELLVIPTGTHQLIVLDQSLQPTPVPDEVVPCLPAVEHSYVVPILSGVIALLLVSVTWLAWSYRSLRALPERPKANAFWKSFLAGTAPIKIILPTPVFFGLKDHPSFRLRSTSVNDFNDVAKDPEFERLTQDLGERSFEQSYTVTWDTLAAIEMARYLDGVGAKDRVSFNVTRDLSPLFLENSNVIAVGTHQTLQPLHDYLQAMNFSLALAELRVTNAKPRPGEQASYEIIHKSPDREVRPSILAVLPGRAPGLKVMLLQSRDTGALVELISSAAGSNSIEQMWKKEGSPPYFEMVTYTELESHRPLRTWPVAIHTFTSQVPANSM